MLKRCVLVWLSVCLMFAFGASVGAQSLPVTIEVGSVSGNPGDAVDVAVSIDPKVHSVLQYKMELAYDTNVLELASDQANVAVVDEASSVIYTPIIATAGTIKVDAGYFDGVYLSGKQKVVTIKFKIKSTAATGDSPVSVTSGSYAEDEANFVSNTSFTAGNVTVNAAPAATATIGIGEASGSAGQSVDVPVTLTQASAGVGSYGMKIDYDKSALEVSKITGNSGDVFDSNVKNDEGWLKVAWVDQSGGSQLRNTGDKLFAITFKIKDGAALGDKALTVVKQNEVDSFTFTDSSAVEMTKTLTAGKVTVAKADVTGVAIAPTTLNLTVGGSTGTLTATVSPDNATNKAVTWASSDTAVATIDANGVVTPMAIGQATITVTTAEGGKTATATVTVAPPAPGTVAVTGVTLDQSSLSLVAGGAVGTLVATVAPTDATNKNVTWTSSNATVATVTYGVVTPMSAGTATITVATEDGGKTATAMVTVTSPLLPPAAPTNLTATPGDGQIALKWDSVTGATYFDVYQALTSGTYADKATATVSGSVYGYTATNLANNLRYYFTVKAVNAAGASAASNEASAVPVGRVSTNGYSSSGSQAPSGASVLVNGKAESTGTSSTDTVNGRTVTTITVDPQKLDERLAAAGNKAIITIPVTSGSDIVAGVLTGQMVKNMEKQQATLELKSDNASYTLPAQQINVDALSAQLGTNVELKDIKIQIQIAKPADSAVQIVENAAKQGEFSIVAPPVDFTISATYNGKTVDVSKFNAYVERTIAIPDGVDPSKITTAIVVDADGNTRHVPTKVIQVDGKYYAQISSLTNSTYTVVWHPLEFSDVANHWAKSAVNDMGSRMVIDGTGNGLFSPDRDITRAEFAAIVVRGLGLKQENGKSAFSDVKSTDWYAGAVNAAASYHLIDGLEDGTFRPNDKITREQAMAIVARAMTVTGLKDAAQGKSAADILRAYTDGADASQWAQGSIAASVTAGIISGRDNATLAPQAYITRAEVAAMIQRLLQKSGLI